MAQFKGLLGNLALKQEPDTNILPFPGPSRKPSGSGGGETYGGKNWLLEIPVGREFFGRAYEHKGPSLHHYHVVAKYKHFVLLFSGQAFWVDSKRFSAVTELLTLINKEEIEHGDCDPLRPKHLVHDAPAEGVSEVHGEGEPGEV